jgi:flagellar assembly protein FliH
MHADFIPFDFNEKKDSPVETTKIDEIEKIFQEAQQKIEEAKKQGYEQGFSEGFKKGSEIQKDEVLAITNALHAIMEEVSLFKEKTIETSEKQILDLCFSIAEKIINQEISSDKNVILSVLKAAFRNIADRENIKVRLNPQDYQYMVEIKNEFISSMDGLRNVFFEEDGSIARGGAIIETSSGEVDARISEQLHEVKAGITNLQNS